MVEHGVIALTVVGAEDHVVATTTPRTVPANPGHRGVGFSVVALAELCAQKTGMDPCIVCPCAVSNKCGAESAILAGPVFPVTHDRAVIREDSLILDCYTILVIEWVVDKQFSAGGEDEKWNRP